MIAISVSLLALVAAILLLVKIRRENTGGFLKFLSYFALFAALVALGFSVSHAVCKSRCGGGKCEPGQHCMVSGKPCEEEITKKCCMEKDGHSMHSDSAKTDGNEVGEPLKEGQEGKAPVQ